MPDEAALAGRHVIRGRLTLKTAMTVRSGDTEEIKIPGSEDTAELALVARDHLRRPYIPGSSLKGVLRSWCLHRINEADASTKDNAGWRAFEGLFGDQPRPWRTAGDEQVAVGGKAEFLDSFLAVDCLPLPRGGQTAIDSRTRAARLQHLRQSELAPEGAVFEVTIVADDFTPNERGLLLRALDAFNDEDEPLALGAATGTGNGRAGWHRDAVYYLSPDIIAKWLVMSPGHWSTLIDRDTSNGLAKEARVPKDELEPPVWLDAGAAVAWLDLHLSLDFETPFLISAPNPNKQPRSEGEEPDLIPSRTADGRGLLPGSSLRGALRAQAERILRTLVVAKNGRLPDGLTERLFGSEGRRSRLEISDFVASPIQSPPAKQEFVAIDRFTNGAARGAKFNIEHLDRPKLTGRVRLVLDDMGAPLRAADIGLIALTLRDFIEGDVAAGYGSRKGYGVPHLTVTAVKASAEGKKKLAAIANTTKIDLGTLGPEAHRREDYRAALGACVHALIAQVERAEAPRAGR